jgi:hypothetical protein
MSVILAALDSTPLARAVLDTAVRLGQLMDADVQAVSVCEDQTESAELPRSIAASAGVPCRLLEGQVAHTLLAALSASEVIAEVIGRPTPPDSSRPVRSTVHHVLECASKPVVMVPPEVVSPGSLRRILVLLEGTEMSSRRAIEQFCTWLVGPVEIVVLHAFTRATVPAILDRPGYDLAILSEEFLIRHCPYATRVEFCSGSVAQRAAELSREHAIDLVLLSWSQHSSRGRAHILQEVLSASVVPVLLLPVAGIDERAAHPLYSSSSRT